MAAHFFDYLLLVTCLYDSDYLLFGQAAHASSSSQNAVLFYYYPKQYVP